MSAPKKISLTLGERVAALRILDAFKGSLSTLRVLLDDVKGFTVTAEEWSEANLVKTPIKGAEGQPDTEQWKWDEKEPKEITIQEGTLEYLKSEIKRKSDAGEITLGDISLMSLEEKL